MKAADARRFIAEQGLTEHVAELVASAPPLPPEAARLWREALRAYRAKLRDP